MCGDTWRRSRRARLWWRMVAQLRIYIWPRSLPASSVRLNLDERRVTASVELTLARENEREAKRTEREAKRREREKRRELAPAAAGARSIRPTKRAEPSARASSPARPSTSASREREIDVRSSDSLRCRGSRRSSNGGFLESGFGCGFKRPVLMRWHVVTRRVSLASRESAARTMTVTSSC